jgi:hypothetical protein
LCAVASPILSLLLLCLVFMGSRCLARLQPGVYAEFVFPDVDNGWKRGVIATINVTVRPQEISSAAQTCLPL